MPHTSPEIRIRAATTNDTQAIYDMICALAEYEKLSHLLEITPDKLHTQLFGENPGAQAIVAEATTLTPNGTNQKIAPPANCCVGFALFFANFSTFLCKPGLYLEDLFVLPQWRKHGIGKALLTHLAQLAVERGYGRFEWSVLDWNQPAIDFYKACGAKILDEWHICRVDGDALTSLAKRK